MAYDIDFEERGLIREHIWDFLLYPEHWNDPTNIITQNLVWNEIPFNSINHSLVPNNQKGIYCFVLKPIYNQMFETRYLFYIGKTKRNFRKRYKEYLDDLLGKGKPRPKVFTMLKLWENYLHFFYTDVPNNIHIDELEEKLINTFIPKVNTDIPKAKIKTELKNIYE
jgi:GIY-YIG catalytic domain